MSNYDVKDSGSRREFGTGAVRDMAEGKGRMDLLPAFALMELGKHFEAGAKKYGDNNWRKGIPLATFLDSALRHLLKFQLGMRDERHDLAALWNMACLIETKHMIDRGLLPKELDNLPDHYNVPELVDQLPAIVAEVEAKLAAKYNGVWKSKTMPWLHRRIEGENITVLEPDGETRKSSYSLEEAKRFIDKGDWLPLIAEPAFNYDGDWNNSDGDSEFWRIKGESVEFVDGPHAHKSAHTFAEVKRFIDDGKWHRIG